MNNIIFAIEINAILEDNTEVTGVTGVIIDNKRVYKLSDNTILSDTKKIKTFKSAQTCNDVEIIIDIMGNN